MERLAELEAKAYSPSAPNLSGTTSGSFDGSETERIVSQIFTLREKMNQNQLRCITAQTYIELWLQGIADSRTRLIFTYRFVDCLTWNEVADKIGGNNTDDSVKKICYRYLKTHK